MNTTFEVFYKSIVLPSFDPYAISNVIENRPSMYTNDTRITDLYSKKPPIFEI